jgi:hypothetical protein
MVATRNISTYLGAAYVASHALTVGQVLFFFGGSDVKNI